MASIWHKTTGIPERAPLTEDIRVEVAVIGAGMTGILLADRLREAGKEAVVLEARRIGSGQTGGTTAKITSQHGLILRDLIRTRGEKAAALYVQGHQNAIRQYEQLVRERQIDCDFQRCRSFLYSKRESDLLREETDAAKMLGLPAYYTETLSLPVPVSGAVCFEQQAMFHPLAFIEALSRDLTVYEQTQVLRVENNRVITDRATVTADYIVFACHFPFVNFPGFFFARMHQERSCVLALKTKEPMLKDMYYGVDPNGFSLRPYQEYVLFGGEGYRTGTGDGGHYEALQQAATRWFPAATLEARWSAQDAIPARGIPYIGRFSTGHLHWFAATGYRKWGMSSAMVAATLIADMICCRENSMEDLYAPDEFSARELPQIFRDGGRSAASIVSHALPKRQRSVRSLSVGEGGEIGWCKGAYKSGDRRVYTVTLRCPHLGCRLHWNREEKTWDCPCHGSRFDRHGRCIDGPAQHDISLS